MEDLLEEIVGEIQDEYDTEVPPIYKESEGIYVVDGLVNLEDLSEYLDYPFECEDADSVAGFVLSHFGRFPVSRESFIYSEWNIEVLEVDQHRVKRLRFSKVHIPSKESEKDENPEDKKA
jgi:CBS domain containing-hemolysin-like protein